MTGLKVLPLPGRRSPAAATGLSTGGALSRHADLLTPLQGLDSLADGAALAGPGLGAGGAEVYAGGIGHRLIMTQAEAEDAVLSYLRQAHAFTRYPWLRAVVATDADTRSVRVDLSAPLHLSLTDPGSPSRTRVGATGAAVVALDP